MKQYPEGQCTWYAANEWKRRYGSEELFFPFPPARNAKRWLGLAVSSGMRTSLDAPSVGAVAVWESLGPYGHVAIVENVHGDATFDVSEYNYAAPGMFGRRERIRVSDVSGFILPPEQQSTELSTAWQLMQDIGVYTQYTKPEDMITAEKLAVFLTRFINYYGLHK